MVKVKKPISVPSNKKNEPTELQNELKESFKKLHLDSKNKTKTIDDYSQLIAKKRKEYKILHKENQQLKIKIQKKKIIILINNWLIIIKE